jgi:SOS-response transcriptional repressor LexA
MKWHERLKEWMSEARWNVPELARRTGIDKEVIYQWLKGSVDNPRGNALAVVAAAFDKTEIELRLGSGALTDPRLTKVPLLSMNKLGTLERGKDPRSIWDGTSTVTAPHDVSPKAFAIVIKDDSCSPFVEVNDVIIVEPQAEIEPGRFVVAVVEDLQRAVFRRYSPRGLHPDAPYQLLAENKHFPPIDIDSDHPGSILGRGVKRIVDI